MIGAIKQAIAEGNYTLDQLRTWWHDCNTHQGRAIVEEKMRIFAPNKVHYASEWIVNVGIGNPSPSSITSVKPRHVMDRALILSLGDAGKPIWQSIDVESGTPLSLRAGCFIAARAREKLNPPAMLDVIVALEAFNEGRVIPSNFQTPAQPKVQRERGRPAVTSLEQWADLNKALDHFLDHQLKDLPELEANRIRLTCRTDLRALTSSWSATIRGAQTNPILQMSKETRQKRLNAALRVLHIDPPRDGEVRQHHLAKIRTQFRRLTRLYHPDVPGTTPEHHELYRTVVEANETIRTLVPELSGS